MPANGHKTLTSLPAGQHGIWVTIVLGNKKLKIGVRIEDRVLPLALYSHPKTKKPGGVLEKTPPDMYCNHGARHRPDSHFCGRHTAGHPHQVK